MSRTLLPLLVAILWLGGCSEPVLDPADLEESIADLRDSLDESRQPAFDAAIDLVRRASRGEIHGTDELSLQGMTAGAVLAEAERIEIRRERAVEAESLVAQRELLGAEAQLARLHVLDFVPRPIGDTGMEADLSVHNTLEIPIETAWLWIEVALPDGTTQGGEEFVSFQPPLRPGDQRTVRMLVIGPEARSLPVEPPAELRTRFRMVERGGEVVLQALSPEERQRAEAALAAAERRVADLDARLAAVKTPE